MPDVASTFTETGSSTSANMKRGVVSIGGTFAGTVAIERQARDGSWYAMESVTAPAVYVIEQPDHAPVRVNCTAYTSGTVSYAIDAGHN